MRMPVHSRHDRVLLSSVLCLFVFLGSAAGQARQQVAGQSSPSAAGLSASTPAPSTPSSDSSNYVGADTCNTCHEEIYGAWEKTPHWLCVGICASLTP